METLTCHLWDSCELSSRPAFPGETLSEEPSCPQGGELLLYKAHQLPREKGVRELEKSYVTNTNKTPGKDRSLGQATERMMTGLISASRPAAPAGDFRVLVWGKHSYTQGDTGCAPLSAAALETQLALGGFLPCPSATRKPGQHSPALSPRERAQGRTSCSTPRGGKQTSAHKRSVGQRAWSLQRGRV